MVYVRESYTRYNNARIHLRRQLSDCAKYINKNYDVAGLCGSPGPPLEELKKSKGDRLKY